MIVTYPPAVQQLRDDLQNQIEDQRRLLFGLPVDAKTMTATMMAQMPRTTPEELSRRRHAFLRSTRVIMERLAALECYAKIEFRLDPQEAVSAKLANWQR